MSTYIKKEVGSEIRISLFSYNVIYTYILWFISQNI